MGFGPTLGSVIIRLSGSVLSVFYLATGIHLFYAALIIFVIPESLSVRRMLQARKLRRERLEEEQLDSQRGVFVSALKSAFRFLHPLEVFYPVWVSNSANPLKKSRRDWNLLLVAVAFSFTISVMVSRINTGSDIGERRMVCCRGRIHTNSSTQPSDLAGPRSRYVSPLVKWTANFITL